jgi:hypothetical protein
MSTARPFLAAFVLFRQLIADAVNSAASLRKLAVIHNCETFPRDSPGITALASARRERTSLQEFRLSDWCPLLDEAAQSALIPNTALDPVLQALFRFPPPQATFHHDQMR